MDQRVDGQSFLETQAWKDYDALEETTMRLHGTDLHAKDPKDAVRKNTDSADVSRGTECDTFRRRTVRKDGSSRTHKVKTPLSMGKPPSPNTLKLRAERDVSRLSCRWWLMNY